MFGGAKDWEEIVALSETVRLDVGVGLILALALAVSTAMLAILLRKRMVAMDERLSLIESRPVAAPPIPTGPTIQEFSRQLMNALGMELPASVANRFSENDPDRFVHALAVYTRAQRRKLLALYNQAEALRDAMGMEDRTAFIEAVPSPNGRRPEPPVSRPAQTLTQAEDLESLCRRAESLTAQLDQQLRDRHQLLLNDIFKAEAKRLELDDGVQQIQSLLASMQKLIETPLRTGHDRPLAHPFGAAYGRYSGDEARELPIQ